MDGCYDMDPKRKCMTDGLYLRVVVASGVVYERFCAGSRN